MVKLHPFKSLLFKSVRKVELNGEDAISIENLFKPEIGCNSKDRL